MTPKELIGVWVKIERAKEHVAHLEREIAGFENRNPYTMSREIDTQTAEYIFRVHFEEEIPARWGAILGDAIHNLRSALDLLGNALIRKNDAEVTDRTGFPISSSQKSFESRGLKEKAKGVSGRAEDLMRRIQPYKGGNGDGLFRLHRLDIMDKHRLLIPVGAAYRNIVIDATVRCGLFSDDPMRLEPFSVNVPPVFPLKNGAEIDRFPIVASGDAYVDAYYKPAFHVAFGEGQVFDGEPITPTLRQLVDLTVGTVALFESEFS